MAPNVTWSAKLALYAGALSGPASVAAILVVGAVRPVWGPARTFPEPLALVAIATVGLFLGVLVAASAGFPMFLVLRTLNRSGPLLIAAWGSVLGGVSYHLFFMRGQPFDLGWVATGALAGFLAGWVAALCLRRSEKRDIPSPP